MQEMQVQSLGQEDPLEKEMATHSSILAWEIPWTEESSRLQSIASQKSWTWLSDWTITTTNYLINLLTSEGQKAKHGPLMVKNQSIGTVFLLETSVENLLSCFFQLLKDTYIPWFIVPFSNFKEYQFDFQLHLHIPCFLTLTLWPPSEKDS